MVVVVKKVTLFSLIGAVLIALRFRHHPAHATASAMVPQLPVQTVDEAKEALRDYIEEKKTVMKGWIHFAMVPVSLIGTMFLMIFAESTLSRVGAAVFCITAVLLFSTSAIYHRGNGFWNRSTHMFLKRLDHANIFFLIAGSSTPFGLFLLSGTHRIVFISVVWAAAISGAAVKILWPNIHRGWGTTFYILLGWFPVAFAGKFVEGAYGLGQTRGLLIVALLVGGGIFYSVGAMFYVFKKPILVPGIFEAHDLFHAFTAIAFVCHYSAISIAAYAM